MESDDSDHDIDFDFIVDQREETHFPRLLGEIVLIIFSWSLSLTAFFLIIPPLWYIDPSSPYAGTFAFYCITFWMMTSILVFFIWSRIRNPLLPSPEQDETESGEYTF